MHTNVGDGRLRLHRMFVPFSRESTWDSFVEGVSIDDREASRCSERMIECRLEDGLLVHVFDVTKTVRAWASGHRQLGWLITPVSLRSAEYSDSFSSKLNLRPKLIIEYAPKTEDL